MNRSARISSVGRLLWLVPVLLLAFTGRAGSEGETNYAHGEVLVLTVPAQAGTRAPLPDVAGLADTRVEEYGYLSSRGSRRFLHLRSSRLSTPELLARLAADPRVEVACPNYRRKLCRVPGDPKWGKLWGLRKINAPKAWDTSIGSAEVVAVVIDTGADLGHPDLAPNLWVNPGEIPGNGIDDDQNGLVDDLHGYDFAGDDQGENDTDPSDVHGHGTHVAGTIAATGDNATGVCGVTWITRIMVLKGFRPDGFLYDSDEIEAVQYATLMKTRYHIPIAVINASYGSADQSTPVREAYRAAGDAGIVVVAAAGNGGSDDKGDDNDQTPFYPASYPLSTIISVAASGEDDTLADFSNYGATSVDIAAPGVSVYSTVPRGTGSEASVQSAGDLLDAEPMTYSGATPVAGIRRPLISCGLGGAASDFPAAVAGGIALIERGGTTFREKAQRATQAGAVAAVIFNNASGNFAGTLGEAGAWIPVVSLSQEDGLLLRSRSGSEVVLRNTQGDYGAKQGTSMASPHVAGAVALLAAAYPGESATQRVGRILLSVEPVSALSGKVTSGGRLNLEGALGFQLNLTLSASRSEARSWTQRQDYATLAVTVESSSAGVPQTVQVQVLRKKGNDPFIPVADFSLPGVVGSRHALTDRYLTPGSSYTYRAQARDGSGRIIGISGDITL